MFKGITVEQNIMSKIWHHPPLSYTQKLWNSQFLQSYRMSIYLFKAMINNQTQNIKKILFGKSNKKYQQLNCKKSKAASVLSRIQLQSFLNLSFIIVIRGPRRVGGGRVRQTTPAATPIIIKPKTKIAAPLGILSLEITRFMIQAVPNRSANFPLLLLKNLSFNQTILFQIQSTCSSRFLLLCNSSQIYLRLSSTSFFCITSQIILSHLTLSSICVDFFSNSEYVPEVTAFLLCCDPSWKQSLVGCFRVKPSIPLAHQRYYGIRMTVLEAKPPSPFFMVLPKKHQLERPRDIYPRNCFSSLQYIYYEQKSSLNAVYDPYNLVLLMRSWVTILSIITTLIASQTDPCSNPEDSLSQQICTLESLIQLYTQKLVLLQSLSPKGTVATAHPVTLPNLIPKRLNSNYTSDSRFLPPGYVLSAEALYDINGRFVEEVHGSVLAIHDSEIATLLDGQLVVMGWRGGKSRREVWATHRQPLPSLWVDRTLVQYHHNVVVFTSKNTGDRQVMVKCPVLSVFQMNNAVGFVCREAVGWVNLADLSTTYLPKFLGQISAGVFKPPCFLYLVSPKNTLYMIDRDSGQIIDEKDFSQLAQKLGFTDVSISIGGLVAFVYSPSSPCALFFNISEQLQPLTPLCLCDRPHSQSATYTHTFTPFSNSIYITCGTQTPHESTVKLYELLLPETTGMSFKWIHYGLIGAAVLLTVGFTKCRRDSRNPQRDEKLRSQVQLLEGMLKQCRGVTGKQSQSDFGMGLEELKVMAAKRRSQESQQQLLNLQKQQ